MEFHNLSIMRKHYFHAAMPAVLCPEGAVRLIDGDIEQEGRVEVCFNGIWGSICSYGWGTSDAYVACKQLGYNPGIGVL